MTSVISQYFPGELQSVGEFRRFVVQALAGLPQSVVEGGVQVASELAGNAVTHSKSALPGGKYLGRVEISAVDVLIQITDQGSDAEVPEVGEDQDLMAESGRGLVICRCLGEIQAETTPDGGRCVSVRIPIRTDGGRS
jgi:anti-sigma regulatory factor (Ser/Thr protein kinase)